MHVQMVLGFSLTPEPDPSIDKENPRLKISSHGAFKRWNVLACVRLWICLWFSALDKNIWDGECGSEAEAVFVGPWSVLRLFCPASVLSFSLTHFSCAARSQQQLRLTFEARWDATAPGGLASEPSGQQLLNSVSVWRHSWRGRCLLTWHEAQLFYIHSDLICSMKTSQRSDPLSAKWNLFFSSPYN